MNNYGLQLNNNSYGMNRNQYSISYSNPTNNVLGMPINEISDLVNKIDFVLGNDKILSKTDSTLERETIQKLNTPKLNILESNQFSNSKSRQNYEINFNNKRTITPQNNWIQSNFNFMSGRNQVGKWEIDGILNDIAKITYDLEPANNYRPAPVYNKYVPLSNAANPIPYSVNRKQFYDYKLPSSPIKYNQWVDQSLDSLIKDVSNISKRFWTGSEKQSQFTIIDPTPKFGFYKVKENIAPYEYAPLGIKSEISESMQHEPDSPISKHISPERNRLVRDVQISPMRFQPDFTPENVKEVQTNLNNDEIHLEREQINEDIAYSKLSAQDKDDKSWLWNNEVLERRSIITRQPSQNRRVGIYPPYRVNSKQMILYFRNKCKNSN